MPMDADDFLQMTELTERVESLARQLTQRNVGSVEAILLCLQSMARTLDRLENQLEMLRKGK